MPRVWRLLAFLAFAGLLTGCAVGPRCSLPADLTMRPTTRPAEPRRPTAVRLVCIDFERTGAATASGFFVSADGLLVTCSHVTRGATPIGVELPDGSDATVKSLVADDPDSDLLLLRIAGTGFHVLPLADGTGEPHERIERSGWRIAMREPTPAAAANPRG